MRTTPLLQCAACLAVVFSACRPAAPEPPAPRAKPVLAPAPETPKDVPNPLVLSLMPVLEPEAIGAQFSQLAAYLGETLETTVELRIAESYEDAIRVTVEERVDLAQLSPLAYVEAKLERSDLSPLVANISEGSSTYSGYLVARRNLRLRRPDQLAGRVIGLVNPHSASGFLYPYAFLLEHGINPEQDVEITMFERHDRLIVGLAEGRIDVGGTFAGALNHAEDNKVDISNIEIIAKTGRIPHDAWIVRNSLSREIREAIRHALLSVSTRDAVGRRVLSPIGSINAFTEVGDQHYNRVRETLGRVRAKPN